MSTDPVSLPASFSSIRCWFEPTFDVEPGRDAATVWFSWFSAASFMLWNLSLMFTLKLYVWLALSCSFVSEPSMLWEKGRRVRFCRCLRRFVVSTPMYSER